MSEELKRCPVCGSRPIWADADFIMLVCNECNQVGALGSTKEKAITAWNTRAGENS